MSVLPSKTNGHIVKMTRAEYNTAKGNRTLLCPNTCLISDEFRSVEFLFNNPVFDIGICAFDGSVNRYYSLEQWTALADKPSNAWTYVHTEQGTMILHDTILTNQKWSNNTSVAVPGCFINSNSALAKLDIAGYENTEAVLAAVTAGTIADAPAFTAARALTFANGATPFIPAAGQWDVIYNNITEINACRAALGQTLITFGTFWTSSQSLASLAWLYNASGISSLNKGITYSVVVVALL